MTNTKLNSTLRGMIILAAAIVAMVIANMSAFAQTITNSANNSSIPFQNYILNNDDFKGCNPNWTQSIFYTSITDYGWFWNIPYYASCDDVSWIVESGTLINAGGLGYTVGPVGSPPVNPFAFYVGANNKIPLTWVYQESDISGAYDMFLDILMAQDPLSYEDSTEIEVFLDGSSFFYESPTAANVTIDGYQWVATPPSCSGSYTGPYGCVSSTGVYTNANDKYIQFTAILPSIPIYNVKVDINDFIQYSISQGWLGSNEWIGFVDAGTEASYGTGDATTSQFSATLGGLLTNPSFETGDATGWKTTGAAAITTSNPQDGLYGAVLGPGGKIGQSASASAGTTYTLYAWAANSTPTAEGQTVYIEADDSGGNSLGSASIPITSNTFTEYGTNFTAPAGTASIVAAADGSAGTLYVDNFTLMPAVTPAPTFSPASGNYDSSQTVSISDAAPGATIYYSIDGTAPTTASTLYSGPITVPAAATIKALATAPGYGVGMDGVASYIIGTVGPNLLANPSFASGDTTGWTEKNERPTVMSVQLSPDGENNELSFQDGEFYQSFTASPGQTYALSAWANTSVVNTGQSNDAFMWIEALKSSTVIWEQTAWVTSETYSPIYDVITMPTGTTSVRASVYGDYGTQYFGNFSLVQTAGTAPVITSLSPSSATLGSSAFTLTVNGTNFAPGSVVNWGGSPRATTYSSSTKVTAQINASDITWPAPYLVTVTNPGGSASAPSPFRVGQAAQTITFTQKAPTSAAYNSSFTVAATGGPSGNPVVFTSSGGCSNGDLSATFTMTSSTTSCTVTANQNGNAYYNKATKVTESVTATLAPQTISFTPSSPVTYGVSPITLSATGGSSGNPVTFTYVSGPGTLSGTNNDILTITGVGTVHVTANQAGNSSYAAATPVPASIVVNPAVLTVTANNQSKAVGAANPTLTVSYSGFQYSDGTGVLSGAPAISTTATTASGAGTYPITVTKGTLSAANYTFAFVNGTLSVIAAPTVVISTSATVTGSHNGGYSVAVKVTNSGTGAASNVTLTSATLGTTNGSPVPQSVATLGAGDSYTFTVSVSGSAGLDGAGVAEKYSGTYTGGSFSASVRSVTLP